VLHRREEIQTLRRCAVPGEFHPGHRRSERRPAQGP
jgi:hypothetical protein